MPSDSMVNEILSRVETKLQSVPTPTGQVKVALPRKPKGDFLSRAHRQGHQLQHDRRVEHNATTYWQYYFNGEHPDDLMGDRPLPQHEYGTPEQQKAMVTQMMTPESVAANGPLSHGKWFDHICEGKRFLESGNLSQAEAQLREAYTECNTLNRFDPRVSRTCSLLGKALCMQGKHDECLSLFFTAIQIDESLLGKAQRGLEEDFTNLADHYIARSQCGEAEVAYTIFIKRLERAVGTEHPILVSALSNLARVYHQNGQYRQAEELYGRALRILLDQDAPAPSVIAGVLRAYAKLCSDLSRKQESQSLLAAARRLNSRS